MCWWTLNLLWWSFQISNHYVIHLKLTWGCLSTVSQLKIYIMQLIQCPATCTSPPPWTTSYSKISPCFTITLPHLHWYPGPVCEEPAFLLPQDHLLEEQPEWTAREGGGVASPGSAVAWWQPLTTSDDSFLSPSDTRKSSRWMACGIWKASPWPRTHQTRVCGRALHPALRSLFCEPTYRRDLSQAPQGGAAAPRGALLWALDQVTCSWPSLRATPGALLSRQGWRPFVSDPGEEGEKFRLQL